jgi:hypothetical protein
MIRAFFFALSLMFFLAPLPAAATDFGNCASTAGYIAAFDPRLSPQACDVITTETIHWRGGSALIRAVHPHSMPMTDNPIMAQRVRDAAAAIGSAIDAMGGNVHLDNITVMFTNLRSPSDDSPDQGFREGAYQAAVRGLWAAECPVSWYKDTVRGTGDDFVFVVSHEVFHCIQLKSWPSMRNDWIVEGGAEYFAYLARPNYTRDDQFFQEFDNKIPNTRLDRLDYSAVVFWLWVGQVYGPPHVRDIFSSAHTIDSFIDPDMWIQFAQAYYDRTIKTPGGARAVPLNPTPHYANPIHADEHLHSPALVPYSINGATFTFERNKAYTLAYSNAPPDVRMLWKRSDAATWTTPPTSVSTCEGDVRYLAIFTTTRNDSFGDIDIHATPATPGMCTCPAGIWQETPQSTRHSVEQSPIPGSNHAEYLSGTRILTLNPDHTGSFIYNDLVTETHSPGDPTFWLHQNKTGGSHFRWTTTGGQLLTILTGGNNLLNMHNEQHTRRGVITENRAAAPQSIGHQFYCDGAGLHLRQHTALPTIPGMPASTYNVDMDFSRIATPSPPPG